MVKKTDSVKASALISRDVQIGIVVSLAVMLMSAGICAAMVSSGMIAVCNERYCAAWILLISSVTGSSIIRGKGNALFDIRRLIMGVGYFGILIAINAVMFDGQYEGVIVSVIVVLTGCFLPLLTGNTGRKKKKTHRSKKRRC